MTTETNSLAADDIAAPELNADDALDNDSQQENGKPDADNQDAPETKEEGDEALPNEASDSGEDAEGSAPKKKSNRVSAKERIQQLTKQRRELEAENERLRKEAETPLEKPKREDFDDDEDYQDARSVYRAKLARTDDKQAEAKQAQAKAQEAKVQAWQAQQEDARERYPDFEAVVYAQNVPFTPEVVDDLLESDMAADVAYVLAKDIPRAQKLAAMTPVQRGREIGRIEAEIEGVASKPKTISKAPPPVQTVSGGSAQSSDPSKLGYEEYRKMMGFD